MLSFWADWKRSNLRATGAPGTHRSRAASVRATDVNPPPSVPAPGSNMAPSRSPWTAVSAQVRRPRQRFGADQGDSPARRQSAHGVVGYCGTIALSKTHLGLQAGPLLVVAAQFEAPHHLFIVFGGPPPGRGHSVAVAAPSRTRLAAAGRPSVRSASSTRMPAMVHLSRGHPRAIASPKDCDGAAGIARLNRKKPHATAALPHRLSSRPLFRPENGRTQPPPASWAKRSATVPARLSWRSRPGSAQSSRTASRLQMNDDRLLRQPPRLAIAHTRDVPNQLGHLQQGRRALQPKRRGAGLWRTAIAWTGEDGRKKAGR